MKSAIRSLVSRRRLLARGPPPSEDDNRVLAQVMPLSLVAGVVLLTVPGALDGLKWFALGLGPFAAVFWLLGDGRMAALYLKLATLLLVLWLLSVWLQAGLLAALADPAGLPGPLIGAGAAIVFVALVFVRHAKPRVQGGDRG